MGRVVVLQAVAAVTALAASGVHLRRWYRLGDGDPGRPPGDVERLRPKAGVGAALMLVAGLTGGAGAVLTYNHVQEERRECRRTLSGLASILEDEMAGRPAPESTFDDPLGLEDQELDSIMDDAAYDFDGVELEPSDDILVPASYDVRKDGAYLGTIDGDGIAATRCDDLAS